MKLNFEKFSYMYFTVCTILVQYVSFCSLGSGSGNGSGA
jgi:hypothetical protein